MDDEETIRQIRDNIAKGNNDIVHPQILELAASAADRPMTLLTCASLFLTLGDEDGFSRVLSTLESNLPSDTATLVQIAEPLIALDVPKNALRALENAGDTDEVLFCRASALHALMRNEEALSTLDSIKEPVKGSDVLRIEILGSLKRFDEAIAAAEPLVNSGDYAASRAYITVLLRAGREKDAQRFAKERAKDKTADGSALMAQYQWLTGNVTATGAYAAKAIKADETHTGAMEYLGYGLASKGNVREAKIVAGAINEREPGNPAAFRIIILCRNAE
jgi:tetratricopeptide (TPR) repeat protein